MKKYAPDGDVAAGSEKTPTVIGIGRAGVRAIGTLAGLPSSAQLDLFACETDSAVLDGCPLDDGHKLLIDREWRNGAGTGGNVTNAQRSMARERPRLEALVAHSRQLIVLCGLGGGTGTAGAQALAGMARRLRIPAVFILTFPFSLEGHGKRRIADAAIKDLLMIVDVPVCLPNDLLFSVLPTDTAVTDAFALADRELANVVLGIADILRGGSLLSADFPTLQEVFKERKSFCCIGVGAVDPAESLNPAHLAVERMLDSPFLGGGVKLKEADAVLLGLTGGASLTVGMATGAFEAAQQFVNPEAHLVVSAAVDPTFGNRLQLVALAVKYDGREASDPALRDYRDQVEQTPLPAVPSRRRGKAASHREDAQQLELPLETVSRGIFINTAQSLYNGVDLDIPTWQRHGVHIDLGE